MDELIGGGGDTVETGDRGVLKVRAFFGNLSIGLEKKDLTIKVLPSMDKVQGRDRIALLALYTEQPRRISLQRRKERV